VSALLCRWIVPASLLCLVLLATDGQAWGAGRGDMITRDGILAALEQSAGPKKGNANASIVLVYFTDFQCGYCRKFAQETLPKIVAEYVERGLVRLVFRHLAILGAASVQASQAAACAEDQGRFWEYHDRLFSTNSSPLAFMGMHLKQQAEHLGLDPKAFAACVDGNTHAQQVETETMLARAVGATGTPAFLIKRQLALGAYPFEAFQQGLDKLLKEKGAAAQP
jgi:protein-disulfide isomerase